MSDELNTRLSPDSRDISVLVRRDSASKREERAKIDGAAGTPMRDCGAGTRLGRSIVQRR